MATPRRHKVCSMDGCIQCPAERRAQFMAPPAGTCAWPSPPSTEIIDCKWADDFVKQMIFDSRCFALHGPPARKLQVGLHRKVNIPPLWTAKKLKIWTELGQAHKRALTTLRRIAKRSLTTWTSSRRSLGLPWVPGCLRCGVPVLNGSRCKYCNTSICDEHRRVHEWGCAETAAADRYRERKLRNPKAWGEELPLRGGHT